MTKSMIYIAFTLLCGAGAFTTDITERITNGNVASYAQFPYSVSVQLVTQTSLDHIHRGHICGGSMITHQHVLTAASCLYTEINGVSVLLNATQLRVFGGTESLLADGDQNRIRTVDNITVHPQYIQPPASFNNIAIITLAQPFSNNTVQPLSLPVDGFAPADFTLCQIASWGALNSSAAASFNLRFTNKYVYSQSLCASLFNQISILPNIFPSMICAASYDIISSGCHGDVGAALVCSGGLAGVMFQTNQCAVSSYPEVYTRVANYTTWIQSITGGSATIRPELTLFAVLAILTGRFLSRA